MTTQPDADLAARSGIRRVVQGHAPNCSSAGSVVSMALVTVAASAAVLSVWAPWLTRWRTGRQTPADGPPPTLRREPDGGVVHHKDSGTRLHVTGAVVEDLVQQGISAHSEPAPEGALSAPTEVHLSLTGRCPVACTACYLGAGPRHQPTDPTDVEATLTDLADKGVMQVALGGGEAIGRLDVVAIGERARSLGVVPNLTTSGFGLTERIAHKLRDTFGQVNVSLDGLGDDYTAARGWDGTQRALSAIRTLVAAGVRTGVNTLLSRPLLSRDGALESIADTLQQEGVHEWQWLRFKPVGRGAQAWDTLAPHPHQLDALWPRAHALLPRLGSVVLRWDCALVPFLAESGAEPARASLLGVRGCPGGHSLAARDHAGHWGPCSFAAEAGPTVDLASAWHQSPAMTAWRQRSVQPPEPCASCDWREVCRGGCRVVSAHLTGDPLAPDPQCPRVRRA